MGEPVGPRLGVEPFPIMPPAMPPVELVSIGGEPIWVVRAVSMDASRPRDVVDRAGEARPCDRWSGEERGVPSHFDRDVDRIVNCNWSLTARAWLDNL